jgi:8-oxo-dGTP diphosphatase
MDSREQAIIHVSAALIVDDAGRLLVVRKRGTSVYMQPGGKPEPGETPAEPLSRELLEELGVHVPVPALQPLGRFTTSAANEAETTLVADVFRTMITEPGAAAAEIDDVRWMHPDEFATTAVAPLITEHMLALLPPARPLPADAPSE